MANHVVNGTPMQPLLRVGVRHVLHEVRDDDAPRARILERADVHRGEQTLAIWAADHHEDGCSFVELFLGDDGLVGHGGLWSDHAI